MSSVSLRFAWATAALLPAFLLPAAGAHAMTLYGAEYGGSALYEIDPTDGSSTAIGGPYGHATNGLAWSGANGLLYAIQAYAPSGQSALWTLDPTSGASTLVGPSAVNNLSSLSFAGTDYSTLYSFSVTDNQVYTLDPTTGAATVLFDADRVAYGLTVRSDGTVFVAANTTLYAYDPLNSYAETTVGTISESMTGLAFDADDNLFGIGISTDQLYAIDDSDGSTVSLGGDIGDDIRGMTFAGTAAPVPVPAAAPLLAGALGALGLLARRRRRG